mmetsp:Transcript_42153/g.78378  ORF Transcript_42153/g.78378 Transcript_42153/m.78378 type:complete len:321 (+) Transcript_42153:154-1116(+)
MKAHNCLLGFLWVLLTAASTSANEQGCCTCAGMPASQARSSIMLQQQTAVSAVSGATFDDANDTLLEAHEELSLLFQLAKRQTFANNASVVSLIVLVLFTCVATLAIYTGLQHFFKKGHDSEERRMLMAAIPSVASMMSMEDAYFTPDLVVPEGCECILFLCAKPRRGQNYDVQDSSGGIVLRVADMAPASTTLRRRLASPQNALLAQCLCAHSLQEKEVISFQLLNGNQECWATLRYEARHGGDDKCVIETRLNQTLFLFGAFNHGALNLTDSYGRLLATTSLVSRNEEMQLRLRVAPMADVGLAMCGLMCLQATAALS